MKKIKYQLLTKHARPIAVTIDECAKEDFKELMKWNERTFEINTIRYEVEED